MAHVTTNGKRKAADHPDELITNKCTCKYFEINSSGLSYLDSNSTHRLADKVFEGLEAVRMEERCTRGDKKTIIRGVHKR